MSVTEDYFNYLEAKDMSEHTVKNYRCDCRALMEFLSKRKNTDDELEIVRSTTLADMHAFQVSMRRKELSVGTRARRTAFIKSFWRYLRRTKVIKEDVAADLEIPKQEKDRSPVYLSQEEAVNLLDVSEGESKERDHCILEFFLQLGLRISEMASLNTDSINSEGMLTVKGKGKKWRELQLNVTCRVALEAYLKVRPQTSSSALFINRSRGRLTARGMHDVVKKYIALAGLDVSKVSAHKLRHTFATLLLQSGSDVRSLQELLGHSSLSTTQIYAHNNRARLRQAVESNPLNKEAHHEVR